MTPRELLDGETTLRSELDETRRAIQDSFATFHQRCGDELFEPLQRIVDDLRKAHGRLLHEQPFDPSGGGEGDGGGAEEWEAIRRYAESVRESILDLASREIATVATTNSRGVRPGRSHYRELAYVESGNR